MTTEQSKKCHKKGIIDSNRQSTLHVVGMGLEWKELYSLEKYFLPIVAFKWNFFKFLKFSQVCFQVFNNKSRTGICFDEKFKHFMFFCVMMITIMKNICEHYLHELLKLNISFFAAYWCIARNMFYWYFVRSTDKKYLTWISIQQSQITIIFIEIYQTANKAAGYHFDYMVCKISVVSNGPI